MARAGLEPAASLVLSQRGLPLPTEPLCRCWLLLLWIAKLGGSLTISPFCKLTKHFPFC